MTIAVTKDGLRDAIASAREQCDGARGYGPFSDLHVLFPIAEAIEDGVPVPATSVMVDAPGRHTEYVRDHLSVGDTVVIVGHALGGRNRMRASRIYVNGALVS